MSLIVIQTKYGQIKAVNLNNRSIKSWLQNNDIMCSTHNERKSVVAETFIRTFIYQNLQIYDISFKKYSQTR